MRSATEHDQTRQRRTTAVFTPGDQRAGPTQPLWVEILADVGMDRSLRYRLGLLVPHLGSKSAAKLGLCNRDVLKGLVPSWVMGMLLHRLNRAVSCGPAGST